MGLTAKICGRSGVRYAIYNQWLGPSWGYPMRIGKIPQYFKFCLRNLANYVMFCPLWYLRKLHSQQFLFCGNNHNPLTCFLMLLQYWLTPIRRVLIAAAYLVKVKINYETYFSEAWYKLYAPLGPLRVDSVSRATGLQYFIYYRHHKTHRYQYCS